MLQHKLKAVTMYIIRLISFSVYVNAHHSSNIMAAVKTEEVLIVTQCAENSKVSQFFEYSKPKTNSTIAKWLAPSRI